MKNRTKAIYPSPAARNRVLAVASLCTALLTGPQVQANDFERFPLAVGMIVGNWYVALDAGPFDPSLAGTFLSGLAQIHADRTFMISDAGDFGAQSFLGTFATPQYGTWTVTGGGSIEGTALHLEANAETGEAQNWTKAHFAFQVVNRNRVEGTVNVFFLPCDDALPIPSPLTCPDPVANADAFLPASPPDVPVTLTRIVAGQ